MPPVVGCVEHAECADGVCHGVAFVGGWVLAVVDGVDGAAVVAPSAGADEVLGGVMKKASPCAYLMS